MQTGKRLVEMRGVVIEKLADVGVRRPLAMRIRAAGGKQVP